MTMVVMSGQPRAEDRRMEKYLSANDASRILGVTGNAVHLMAKRGELPVAGETVSGIRLFRLDDVRKLAAERAAKGRRARGVETAALAVEGSGA
jgi:hypothetical protein